MRPTTRDTLIGGTVATVGGVGALLLLTPIGDLLFGGTPTAPVAVDYYLTLADLSRVCVVPGPNDEKPGCMAYVAGVADMLLNEHRVCITATGDSLDTLTAVVIRYLEDTPEPATLNAAVGISALLEKTYPCTAPHRENG